MEPFPKNCLWTAKFGIFEALPAIPDNGRRVKDAVIPDGMRKIIVYALLILLLLPSCSGRTSNNTIRVVKPKYHHRFFVRKHEKYTKRVKMVKMKN
jgi:hypothetical protein